MSHSPHSHAVVTGRSTYVTDGNIGSCMTIQGKNVSSRGFFCCFPCVHCRFRFSPFYWVGIFQSERAQHDFKVPYKVPHFSHPLFTYERQPQHRDHPSLIRIVRGFFNVPQNYQHSRNCETGPPAYRPYPRRLESLTIFR